MVVLLAGDHGSTADELARELERQGQKVAIAPEAADAEPDLLGGIGVVLLGRCLSSGQWAPTLTAIKRLRPTIPVILVSDRCDPAAKIEGLDLGASDYVTRPIAVGELAARIRARLRESTEGSNSILVAAGIRLNRMTKEAVRSERIVFLSERECDLLAYLMQRAGELCTRREILSAVWAYNHDPESNIVQVYVGYLRRRLSFQGTPLPVETVRALGYRLNTDA